jgi:hypothetical protein
VNRKERDSFAALTPTDIEYGEGACLETPPAVFARLHERFCFDIDLTANEQNHLMPNWIGPGSRWPDALTANWCAAKGRTGIARTGFSNPPYGPFIPKILTKALQERDLGFTSVFLLPNRSGGWFTDLVLPYYSELWFCQPRITFWYQGRPRVNPETKKNLERRAKGLAPTADGALFDSIIVIYEPVEVRHVVQGLLFPVPRATRPNVWNWKTGELRY